jgi:hypothetical protein
LGYLDYHLLGPLAPAFAIAGNIADAKNYPNRAIDPNTGEKTTAAPTDDQVIADAADRVLSYLADSTGLRTLGDLYTVLKGGPQATPVIAQFVGGIAGGFVLESGLLASVAKGLDTEGARKPVPGNIAQTIEQNIPGLRETVPLRRDVLGRVIPNEQAGTGALLPARGSAGDVINPETGTGGTGGPVLSEVMRLRAAGNQVGISAPSVSGPTGYHGAQQTPEQQSLIQKTVGNAVNLYALNVLADPHYASLSDQQKADALSKAIDQAHQAANIDLGGNIARDPHNTALLQWQQTPHYAGVSGSPDQIARMNFQIAEAKVKLAEYTRVLGQGKGEMRMRLDDPAAFRLAQRDRRDSDVLKRLKASIDAASGGALSKTSDTSAAGGLIGAGSTLYDTSMEPVL